MASAQLIGLVLVIIGVGFLFLILPNMIQNTRTSPGTPLENSSTTVKAVYSSYDYFIAVMPFILIGAGVLLAFKGR